MIALVIVGLVTVAYLAHLWFDPHTLRGRWREIHPNYLRKHGKD